MVFRKMGRYWSKAKRWKISTLWQIYVEWLFKEEIPQVRTTCKSHTNDKASQKASAVARKRAAGNPGGKPTNVPTFAKKQCGGIIDTTKYKIL
jgi:hypothetical protein